MKVHNKKILDDIEQILELCITLHDLNMHMPEAYNFILASIDDGMDLSVNWHTLELTLFDSAVMYFTRSGTGFTRIVAMSYNGQKVSNFGDFKNRYINNKD